MAILEKGEGTFLKITTLKKDEIGRAIVSEAHSDDQGCVLW